ncbi:putative Complete genome; segment 14/17 [Xenorhabdus poinarii G6]|uniref:Putative Complete genome segment 14/17 n=1 Tax=Xenorhabdus poinarii G6 TaxID=1354304 RepID=A0A068R7H3_9GAMM|nr:hypothetical protein [Xenorhabdus poinarii]CDG22959.1 putative Complete genome; segment 14/17 [Xenorhabdus poinarii G6]
MEKIINDSVSGAAYDQNFITVHVAKPGTKLKNPDNTTGISRTGHVWMTIERGKYQESTDIGWSTGSSLQKGGYDNVSLNDSVIYDKKTVKSYTVQIPGESREKLMDFINQAPLGKIPGFSPNYNLFTNNCVHFVRKALNYANANIGGFLLPHFTPSSNYENIAEMIGENYKNADTWGEKWKEKNYTVLPHSPLIVDLNGDGVITIPEGDVYFDINNDGESESIGWVDKNDGLLVYDNNNDGKIVSGSQLFGNYSIIKGKKDFTNGFEALSELDSNNDLIISKDDKEWDRLKVWKDENSNAIVDENELVGLSDIGIKEINLTYRDEAYVDQAGNAHKETSFVTWDNGEITDIVDVWFQSHPKLTKEDASASTQQEIHKMINSMAEFSIESVSSSINQITPRQDTPMTVLATPLVG